jgi:hypothetical protein
MTCRPFNVQRIPIMLLATLLFSVSVVAQDKPQPDSFVLDPSRPFIYLKFDHFGPGAPWGDNEVPFRIWFRLVNNCRVPIKIRTFGGPGGALGVMDRVVEDEKILTITADHGLIDTPEPSPISDLIPELPLPGSPSTRPSAQTPAVKNEPSQTTTDEEPSAKMPSGYESEASSSAEIAPGRDVYFSLPANHLSTTWHFVIPFTFVVPLESCCRPADIAGEPENLLRYDLWDLPDSIKTQIKKL